MERPSWAPEHVDVDRPSQARTYDYLLGGSHNFAVDREMARRSLEVMPDVAVQAQANRAFAPNCGCFYEIAIRADDHQRNEAG